ncbi:MAG: quinone oxidoreductase [Bradyrhizobium sp. 35-63-5]|nr:MAG: quinone oxidoreductase [Bradyrhizobium sp. 35-63-5]
MKAVLVATPGGIDALDYVDVAEPACGPDDVVIRAETFGVGVPDTLIRSGKYKWMPPLPANPGNDAAGRIAAVGANVRGIAVGQKVLLSARDLAQRGGCYAELIAAPAEAVHLLPENADLKLAVCLANYQVAYALLHEARGKQQPKSVLVIGAAGGVGSALVQLAKLDGMTVIGTVSSEEKAAFARAMGADGIIFYRREDVVARTRELTQGEGVDLILDHAGGKAFTDLLGALAKWGTLVTYNGFGDLPEKDLVAELRKHMAICPGVRSFSFHIYDHDREGRRAIMREIIGYLASGAIKPAVAARLKLSDVRRAHALLESGAALGKIVMTA